MWSLDGSFGADQRGNHVPDSSWQHFRGRRARARHHERRGLGDAAPEIDNSIAPPRMEDARPDAEEVVVRVPSELGVGLPLGSILWPEG